MNASDVAGAIQGRGAVVVHFAAEWCGPSKQMEAVVSAVPAAKDVTIVKVEAEDVPEVSIQHKVVSVPTFILFHGGKEVSRVEGANAPALVKMINEAAKMPAAAPAAAAPASTSASASATGVSAEDAARAKKKLNARIKSLITQAPVVLFMKGTADEPRCGFSRKAIGIMKGINVDGAPVSFTTFDILEDEAVRQGIKEYSNWPTFPQLYIDGELVGGLDIMAELAEEDELEGMFASAITKEKALNERIGELINSADVMVFIKGTPEEPRCGFSRKMVGLLNDQGVTYSHFDILSDEAVRQGIKRYSNWPTFPQLYAKGQLVGGNDIAMELAEEGELAGALGLE